MQEIEDKKQTQIFCKEHKGRGIKYVNLDDNNLNDSYYPLACYVCRNNNKENHLYVPIEEILENDDNQAILNWPRGMNKDCKDFLESHSMLADNDLNELRKDITQFYDDMIEQLVTQIRESKKQNLMLIDQYEHKTNDLFNFYNQAFKRQELKLLFSNIDHFSCQKFKEFLSSLEKTRKKDLDLFEIDIQWVVECEKNLKAQSKQCISKQQIQKIMSVMNFQQEIENPFDYFELSQHVIDSIQELIDHSARLEQEYSKILNSRSNNSQYIQSIENSFEYKYLESIIESNINFMNPNFKEEIKEFLKESYPLLKRFSFIGACTNEEKFNFFKNLSESEIEDLYRLMKKRLELNEDSKYNSSQTKVIQDKTRVDLQSYINVSETFRKYPIFDLLAEREIKANEIRLIKTNFNDGNKRIVITDDQEVSFNQTYFSSCNFYGINCVSNVCLEKDKKYIFRFKATYITPGNGLYFGLVSKSNCETQYGYQDKLCCRFTNSNQEIYQDGSYGVETYLRGDKMKLRGEEEQIEMRVWLGNQQLEILDYPNYNNLITLTNRQVLSTVNDLKLYIGFWHQDQTVTLTYCVVVDNFPN